MKGPHLPDPYRRLMPERGRHRTKPFAPLPGSSPTREHALLRERQHYQLRGLVGPITAPEARAIAAGLTHDDRGSQKFLTARPDPHPNS